MELGIDIYRNPHVSLASGVTVLRLSALKAPCGSAVSSSHTGTDALVIHYRHLKVQTAIFK